MLFVDLHCFLWRKWKKVDPFEKLTEQLDSMNVGSDSVLQDTMVLVEEVIPVTVDESFADFFYNFASDEKFPAFTYSFSDALL